MRESSVVSCGVLARVQYDLGACEQFFVPVSTTGRWRGMLKTRAPCLRSGPLSFPRRSWQRL